VPLVALAAMQVLSVEVMGLTSWSAGSETPSDCDSLLELIHLVAERQRQHQSSSAAETSLYDRPTPIIVQCL